MASNRLHLLLILFLAGCAGSMQQPEYPSAKVPSTAPSSQEQLKCRTGETLICQTRRRISDRRFGRNSIADDRFCSCYADLPGIMDNLPGVW
ncbi:MAG TPA: hypothetical protein QGF04_03790 [Woeseiaceae bacterium]|nr:hypothetical protein [Woeseiaceae bacterium]